MSPPVAPLGIIAKVLRWFRDQFPASMRISRVSTKTLDHRKRCRRCEMGYIGNEQRVLTSGSLVVGTCSKCRQRWIMSPETGALLKPVPYGQIEHGEIGR